MLKRLILFGLIFAIALIGRIILRPAAKRIQPAVQTDSAFSGEVPMPALRWPPGSEHIFAAPDPTWVMTTYRFNPLTGKLINLSEPNVNIDGLWTDISYRESGRPGLNDWRKLRRWDAKGRLKLEIDKSDGEQFSREFNENGTLAFYEHLRGNYSGSKWVGAVSLDPNGVESARVENGSGKTIKTHRSGAVQHTLIHYGTVYLSKTFVNGTLSKLDMYNPKGQFSFDLSAKKELLDLAGDPAPDGQLAPGERWEKAAGKAPELYIDTQYINGDDGKTAMYFLDEKTQRRRQELASRTEGISLNGPREHIEKESQRYDREQPARAALRVPEYAKIRTEFLDRYSKYLQQIGTSLEAVGLSDVLKEPLP